MSTGGRNDAALYTGLSSPARREQLKAKTDEPKLDPKAEDILTLLTQLKAEAMDVRTIVLDEATPDDVKLKKIERMRERYDDLNKLEVRFKKLLGIKWVITTQLIRND